MVLRLLAAIAAFVVIPTLAAAQQQATPPGPPPFAPQPGMQFTGTLQQNVSSKNANVGDQITLMNVNSTDGQITGARMYGHIVSVTRAGQGRNAQVLMSFDTLQLPDGESFPVVGEVTQAQVNTKNNGAKEAIGTVGGMIVGNILGKWIGTNVGGLLGAAGGYIIAKNNREDVTIPANSNVSVRLVQPRPQAPAPQDQQYNPAEPQPGNVPPAGPGPAGTPLP
jgi:hypothetical protein